MMFCMRVSHFPLPVIKLRYMYSHYGRMGKSACKAFTMVGGGVFVEGGDETWLHARFCRLWDRPLMPLVSQNDSGEVASFILDPVLEELVEEDEG